MQDSNGRRLYTYLVSFGLAALLVLIVVALDTFGGDTSDLSPLVQSPDAATGYLIFASAFIMLWSTSVFYRCTDSYVKGNMIIIGALLLLWMLAAIVREIASGYALLRYSLYSFSVPLSFIPALMLFNALHVSSLDYHKAVRVVRWVVVAVSSLLVILAFTNDLHGLYFDPAVAQRQSLFLYPSTLQAVLIVWGTTLMMVAGIVVLVASRCQVRIVVGLLVIVALLWATIALVYVFNANTLFDDNLTIIYAVAIMLISEICLRAGVVGSYAGFSSLFAKLPFDLKLLTPDKDLLFRTQYKTDVATPLRAEEKEQLVKLSPLQENTAEFRVSSVPNRMYRTYGITGGIVLLSADSSILTEETNRLEKRQEMLQQQVSVLEQRNTIQQRLQRQKRERELFEDIESSLRSATTTIQTIIASLAPEDTPESRTRRRQQLVLVKLLVAYCKRKGSLVLASKGGVDFDRDRLMVIINEMVTDMRTAGAECAAIIEVDTPLSSYVVNQLYDCLYDFVTIAFQHADPLIMIFVQTAKDDTVRLRAQLEDSMGIGDVQTALSDQLVKRLEAAGIDHEFERGEDDMRLNVTLPIGEVQ